MSLWHNVGRMFVAVKLFIQLLSNTWIVEIGKLGKSILNGSY
jgi:hypothetical protein